MCAHRVDELGYPLDPELDALEDRLNILAGMWRGSLGNLLGQGEIVREYHAILTKLYSLGWDGVLDIDGELPDELMPDEYLRRHGRLPDDG